MTATRGRLCSTQTLQLQVRPGCSSSTRLNRACFVCFVDPGITRFDLLGDFGRYNWLGNFYIVFLYNMLFAGLTSASLIKTVTWAVQRELIRAFGQPRLNYSLKISVVCCVLTGLRETLSLLVAVSQLSPPLAPFPCGLVSLPQIERIQSLQESAKGQEESRSPRGSRGAPPWTPRSTHTPCLSSSAQHKQALPARTRQAHTCTQCPFLTAQIASLLRFPTASAHFCSVINRHLVSPKSLFCFPPARTERVCNVALLLLLRSPPAASDRVALHRPLQAPPGQRTLQNPVTFQFRLVTAFCFDTS